MFGQDLQTMEAFADRLKKAAAHKQVKYSATEIGRSLGLAKQTVHRWMKGSAQPSPENLYLIADRWEISARWLATGEGYIISVPAAEGLTRQEQDIIATYRSARPDGRTSLRAFLRAIGKGALGLVLALALWQPQPTHASFSSHVAALVYYGKSRLRRILTLLQQLRTHRVARV
jgi:transcriptional regulator with XRE-family HTH domain